MLPYIFRRLVLFIPTIFLVASFVFILIHLVPGDPIDTILGENASMADRQQLLVNTGFDKPIFVQWVDYWKKLLQGDLGKSYFSNKSVAELIKLRFPNTVILACLAMMWAITLSIPMGIIAALKKGTPTDNSILFFSLFGISMPSFYLGPVLILVFSVILNWFPLAGARGLTSVILPSITLGLALSAFLIRMTRAQMLDVLRRDYIRTAQAKGLPRYKIILSHALGSALLPIISILGLQFGALLTGTIVIEKIYSWPGLGTLMLESILRRDYAVVQGCVLVIALVYVGVNLVIDILYRVADPRVR